MASNSLLSLDYQGHPVRWGGTKDAPWFVAQDVCDILGIKEASSAVREFPSDEKGMQSLHTLGGKQDVLVVYEPGLYRLLFRSTKPEAEAFRRWVLHDVLPAIRKTGEYRSKQREKYAKLGYSEEWIETREQGIEARKTLTGTLQDHGIKEGMHFGTCTNGIYKPLLGGKAHEIKKRRQLPVKANLRDNLPLVELLQVALSESLAQEKINNENRNGLNPCYEACVIAGQAIARAVDTARQLPNRP
jgi:prophage antirepressor-like protein